MRFRYNITVFSTTNTMHVVTDPKGGLAKRTLKVKIKWVSKRLLEISLDLSILEEHWHEKLQMSRNPHRELSRHCVIL